MRGALKMSCDAWYPASFQIASRAFQSKMMRSIAGIEPRKIFPFCSICKVKLMKFGNFYGWSHRAPPPRKICVLVYCGEPKRSERSA